MALATTIALPPTIKSSPRTTIAVSHCLNPSLTTRHCKAASITDHVMSNRSHPTPSCDSTMKQPQYRLENAENCPQLAESATDEPSHNRYKRMEAAWRALAEEQDWLDGKVHPLRSNGDA